MRILIANNRLAKRTGTEIVTRDFALGLRARGHAVAVWTPRAGPFAEEVRAGGVPVFADLSAAPFAPDVLHVNQHEIAPALFAAFGQTPALLHVHVPGAPVHACAADMRFRALYGVSAEACHKLAAAAGRPADGILGNFVDPALYAPRGPLPEKPGRWLIVAEKKHGLRHAAKIALLALKHRARLAAVGPRVRRLIDNVPAEAAKYDLVFASARCAIEAAAAGAGVVVTDYRGVAGLLGPGNARELLEGNFGAETFVRPATLAALDAAIGSWDPDAAAAGAAFIRAETGLARGLDRLEEIYRRIAA